MFVTGAYGAGRVLLGRLLARGASSTATAAASEAAVAANAARTGAYETAAAGGRHAGLLRNYAGRAASEIRGAVESLERNVAQHLDKIAHPERYVRNWANLSSRAQQGTLRKWQADAVRNAQEAEVLKGLLR